MYIFESKLVGCCIQFCVFSMISEECKYLESEDRIKFLMGKIQDIRKLYMQLKSEVACIDRRRKRQRRKLHDGKFQSCLFVCVCVKI